MDMYEKKHMRRAVLFLQRIIWFIFLLVIGYLLVVSIFSTCYLGAVEYHIKTGEMLNNTEHTFYVTDNYMIHILFFTLFSVVMVLIKRTRGGKRISKYLGWGAISLSAVLICYIVLAGRYEPWSDQAAVLETAEAFRKGDYSAIAPGGYLFMFPYQGGIVLFYWLLSALFGSRNIIAYQFVNAFFNHNVSDFAF